jgi:hypothetical protein
MRNNSAPPKWSKLWINTPQPSDPIGAYSTKQLERMNQEFTAAVEHAFRVGDESEIAAKATCPGLFLYRLLTTRRQR